jgi:hypothetical protein
MNYLDLFVEMNCFDLLVDVLSCFSCWVLSWATSKNSTSSGQTNNSPIKTHVWPRKNCFPSYYIKPLSWWQHGCAILIFLFVVQDSSIILNSQLGDLNAWISSVHLPLQFPHPACLILPLHHIYSTWSYTLSNDSTLDHFLHFYLLFLFKFNLHKTKSGNDGYIL